MVAFRQGEMTVLMDRDAFDYTYGDASGPDPDQRDLDALLPGVTRVCVLEGAMFRGRAMGGPVMVDVRDAGAIRELAGCLKIVEDPATFGHRSCLGGPTMELYAGLEHVATIGLRHARAIRWKRWHHDAQLRVGDGLTRWLHAQGGDPGRLEAIYERGNIFPFGGSRERRRRPTAPGLTSTTRRRPPATWATCGCGGAGSSRRWRRTPSSSGFSPTTPGAPSAAAWPRGRRATSSRRRATPPRPSSGSPTAGSPMPFAPGSAISRAGPTRTWTTSPSTCATTRMTRWPASSAPACTRNNVCDPCGVGSMRRARSPGCACGDPGL